MRPPYDVTLSKKQTIARKREPTPRSTVIRAEDAPDPKFMKYASSDWGCEPLTPAYTRQDLAFMYASRRLLEEITKTRATLEREARKS